MAGISRFEPGFYDRSPGFVEQQQAQNLSPPIMNWSFDGLLSPGLNGNGFDLRDCPADSVHFVIDRAEYSNDDLLEILDMRISCSCEEGYSAHGRLYWDRNDQSVPPGPAEIPDDLWDLSQNRTMADGNYLYIENEQEAVTSYEFDFDNSQFVIEQDPERNLINFVALSYGQALLSVAHMSSIDKFEIGFYGEYNIIDNGNPAAGYVNAGISRVQIDGTELSSVGGGWYTVDHVVYSGDRLEEIIIRFETRTWEPGQVVRGKLFWSNDSDIVLSNPEIIPGDIWQPPSSLLNACSGDNYLKVEIKQETFWADLVTVRNENDEENEPGSDVLSKYIVFEGIDGVHAEFPAADSWLVVFSAETEAPLYSASGFGLHIRGTYLQDRLEEGYYADILDDNPAKGRINIGLGSQACSVQEGWMVVDDVEYGPDFELLKLDLRFGLSCLFEMRTSPAMRGVLSWRKTE